MLRKITAVSLSGSIHSDVPVKPGTAPVHGTASVNSNGTVLYTPALNYEGSDSFAYAISDNQGGSAAAIRRKLSRCAVEAHGAGALHSEILRRPTSSFIPRVLC